MLPAELDLFPKRWRLFDGYVWAQPSANLEWKRARKSRIEFALRLPARITPARAAPRGEAGCEDLALEPRSEGEYVLDAIGEKTTRALWTSWRAAERVPLSRSPHGAVVAWLDTRPEAPNESDDDIGNESDSSANANGNDRDVNSANTNANDRNANANANANDGNANANANDGNANGNANGNDSTQLEPEHVVVFERRGTFARVAYLLENWVVVGWVPLTALEGPSEPIDSLFANGPAPEWDLPIEPFAAEDPTPRAPSPTPQTCAWNAPLATEAGGALRAIGTLAGGIPLVTRASRNGLREVTFEHPALEMNAAARFWIPEHALYPCGAVR